MALAVSINDRRGPSNQMHHQLQQGNTLLAVNIAAKVSYMHCTLLTRRSMALAIDIMHGSGPSNKLHTQLQP